MEVVNGDTDRHAVLINTRSCSIPSLNAYYTAFPIRAYSNVEKSQETCVRRTCVRIGNFRISFQRSFKKIERIATLCFTSALISPRKTSLSKKRSRRFEFDGFSTSMRETIRGVLGPSLTKGWATHTRAHARNETRVESSDNRRGWKLSWH